MEIKDPEKWRPLTGMPENAVDWGSGEYRALAGQWRALRRKIRPNEPGVRFVERWLEERKRAFCIETGQVEYLYTLAAGITEQLIAEGYDGVIGAHSIEGLPDETLKGFLEDQQGAYDMMFQDVASGRPLSKYMVCSWHQLITQHQETVTGLDPWGKRIEVPFETRGRWKIRPNNPRRRDGKVHQYCPPEIVEEEMQRFFELHEKVCEAGWPVNVEAAWGHHRFVRAHPFQDGNGRVSRLIMAWSYIKRDLPPPVVTLQEKDLYIDALEAVDAGNLKAFSDYLNDIATPSLRAAVRQAEKVMKGRMERPTGNGGRVVRDQYFPPRPQ